VFDVFAVFDVFDVFDVVAMLFAKSVVMVYTIGRVRREIGSNTTRRKIAPVRIISMEW
jgi:hypothetical protein